MYKFRKFINMHKKQIIVISIAVVMFIIVLQIFNYNAKKNIKEGNIKNDNFKTIDYRKEYGVISGETKNEDTYKNHKSIMEEFTNYCNDKNYEKAYNFLTDNCKKVLYPNIEIFKTNYCNINFDKKKTCKFQLWNEDTYQVQMRIDSMSTGSYTDSYIQDYFTVSNGKLNISGYIKRVTVNTETQKDNIKVKVNSIDYYMDYTKVNLNITNLDDKQILIDSQVNENSVVLKDKNNLEYTSNINEFNKEDLKIDSKDKKDITLKFEVAYRSNLEITDIILKKILKILDVQNIGLGGNPNTVQIDVDI